MAVTGQDLLNKQKKNKKNVTGKDLLDRYNRSLSSDTSMVDQKYIDSFLADADLYFNSAEKDYGGVNWGNASQSYTNRDKSWQDLSNRANSVSAWLYKNRANVSDETYTKFNDYFKNFYEGGQGIVDSFKSSADFYGGFDTEEAYNDWKKKQDALDAIRNSRDYSKYVESGKKNQGNTFWNDLRNMADAQNYSIGELISDISNKNWEGLGGRALEAFLGMFPQVQNAVKIASNGLDARELANKWLVDRSRMNEYLSDEEMDIYHYYIGKGDYASAEEYFNNYSNLAKMRSASELTKIFNNNLGETATALGAGVSSFTEGYDNLLSKIGNVLYDKEATLKDPTAIQYAYNEMQMDNTGLWKVTNDLAQTLGNQLPSMALNAMTGGVAGASIMGFSAAGNAYTDFKRLGYSDAQALAYGTTIGVLEAKLQEMVGGISGLGSNGGFVSKALNKALPKITNSIARFAIKLGGSMADEAIEEAAQTALEPLVQAFWSWGKTIDWNDENAVEKFGDYLGEIAYSGLLGGLSAGLLEGAPSAVNAINTEIGTNKAFKEVSNDPEALKSLLMSIALENPQSNANQLLEKGTVSPKELKNLVYSNEQTLWNKDRENMVNATEKRLAELGEKGDLRKLAETVVKAQYGYDYTDAMEASKERLANTKGMNAKDIAYLMAEHTTQSDNKIDLTRKERKALTESEYGRRVSTELNPNMRGETTSSWADEIKTNRIGKGAEGVAKTQATLKALRDATTSPTASSNAFNYKSSVIAPTLTKEGVQAKEKDLEGIATNRGYKGTTHEAFVKNYNGEDIEEYQLGFDEAYKMGRNNIPKDELKTAQFREYINEAAQTIAYNSGKIDAKYEAMKTKSISVKGGAKVTIPFSTEAMTESRKATVELMRVLAEVTGANMNLMESRLDHGLYDRKTDTISIDLNLSGKDYTIFSLAHELTHRIRETLPEQFNDFAEMLFAEVGKEVSISERIKIWEQQNKKYYPKLSSTELNDLAYEEVVCEMCESFLTDEVVARKLSAKLQSENKTLWEKIKSFLTDFINKLKEAYKGLDPQSENGRLVRDLTNDLTKVKEAWAVLIVESGNVEVVIKQDLENKDISHSRKYYDEHLADLDKKYDSDEAMVSLETLKKRYEKVVEIWDRLGGELNSNFLEEWNNKSGKDRSFTVFKAQAGYKYNIELSSMCKKGVPLFEAIDTIVNKEVMKQLNTKVIGKAEKQILYDLLQKKNFDIPCQICYVEQARQREGGIIDAFLNGKVETNKKGETTKVKLGWNQILNEVEKEMKNLGVEYKFSSMSRAISEDSYTPTEVVMDENTQKAFYEALKKVANDEIKRYNKAENKARQLIKDTTPSAINATLGGTLPSNLKIIKTLFMESNSRLKIESDLLYSSMTTKNLATFHHDLYTAFNMQGGVSGYKTKQGTVVYWGDILKKTWEQDTIRKAGGIRNQSNSDFQMYTFLDQAQMYIDFSAKGYYLQAYTKVLAELKLFGKSNAKINASLIPRVQIYRDGNDIDVERTKATAGLDENGNLIFDDIEGINHKEAFMLIEDPEYSRSIGGICIGYSDPHIAKMLDDNRIQLIIGYHDKTDDPNARYRGARYAKNYNGLNEAQNGTKTVHIGFNKFVGQAEKKFGYDVSTETFAKDTITYKGVTYGVNDIPRLAANLYLEECERKGYAPAYSKCDIDFSKHPNYYKLLADFSLYNSKGEYCPHKKVQFNMPSTVPYIDANGIRSTMSSEEYMLKELKAEMAVRDSISEALADESEDGLIPSFIREVNKPRDDMKHSFKGVGAEDNDSNAFNRAKEMTSKGVDSETVRKETGWFIGYDGKWRYEIDDSQAIWHLGSAKPDPKRLWEFGERIFKLSDILEHAELYKAYPQLKGVTVWEDPFAKTTGYVVGNSTEAITVKSLADTNINKDILIHEIQHLIQNIEGFAKGGSVEQFEYKAWGEREYAAYEKRNEIANKLYAILRRHGRSITKADIESVRIDFTTTDGIIDENFMFLGSLADANPRTQALLDEYYDQVQILNLTTPTGQYHALAGEVEAYDAQARRRMTSEERKNTRPNIDRRDVTLVGNSEESNDLDENLGDQLDEWLTNNGKKGNKYNGVYFKLGTTPDIFIKHGAKKVEMIMYNDVVAKVTGMKGDEAHVIALSEIAKLPSQLNDPILLFKGSVPNSFIALTELVNKQGHDVVVAVHINRMNGRSAITKIASLYSKTNDYRVNRIVSFVTNQINSGNLLDASAKKAPMWFSTKGLQLPKVVQTIIDANNSIAQNTDLSTVSSKNIDGDLKRSRKTDDFLDIITLEDLLEWDDMELYGGDTTIEDISEELNTTPERIEILFKREGLGDSYIEDGRKAVMTQARINNAIEYNGASNPRYARRLITRISPKDFIDLTVMRANQNRDVFDSQVEGDHGNTMGNYDYEGAMKTSANPYLVVDVTTGRVIGHNGRHRMRAMELLGIESVEIEVELYDDGIVKYHDGIIKDLAISSQFDTKTETHLSNIIPLNESYRADIEALYGENANPDASIKYSRKIPDPYSSRELLAKALTKVAKGEEKTLLEQYKSNLRMIKGEYGNLKTLRKEIDEIKYKKSITYKGDKLSVREFEQIAYTQAEAMGYNAENVKFKAIRESGKYVAMADGKVFLEADKVFRSKEEADHLNTLEHNYQATLTRISKYDASLLKIEAMKPIKDLLTRERAKAYKEAEAKGKEALKEYKAQAIEEQKAITQRYQEMRHKNVEKRATTEMRHKLMNTVHTLDQLLVNPTKKKHIPIGLQKPVAETLNILNMDTVGAEERLAKIVAELKVTDDAYQQEILLERYNRIKAQGDKIKSKIDSLKAAYAEILNSEDDIIRNAYDEVIANTIEQVASKVGDTAVRDMNYEQLESLYKMYRMILKTVRDANKSFKMAKGEEISTLGQNVMAEVAPYERKDKSVISAVEWAKTLDWNNLKPTYAFERIGSKTLTELYNNVRAGEDVWATDMAESRAYSDAQKAKYGYKNWDMKKEYTFQTPLGKEFKLNLGQIMSIYAYTRRGEQAIEHLTRGGFVYDGVTVTEKKVAGKIKVEAELKDSTAYRLDEVVIAQINSTLTKEQREFAEAMQKYLSETMGEKGNEVALAMYDIKLFGEKNYFPLKSSHVFLERAKEQARGEVKIKNKGFTKETTPRANNPITLSSFMDVWTEHCIEMSMYHAFTLPLEDFYRVYNYKERATDDKDTEAVTMFLENAYGKSVTNYIDQLLVDINGGTRADPRAGLVSKGISTFKKAAVFASASVVVQQPSSIARALAIVDPKYFVDKISKYNHKETWAEVKKYAPVALIKEMGYFDVGVGQSSKEWLLNEPTKRDKMDEALSKAPALADEWAWCLIWKAVKRETVATHPGLKINSDEFLKICGERFTEVITKTQVYDSVFARSGNMRSKDTGMKMAMAFMAEPTTILNMLENAIVQAKRGDKRYAGRAVGACVASAILNSMLVSIVYGARDDDEDKEYWEKYLDSLGRELLDSFNPLTLMPYVKDIISIFEGYSVSRSDLSIVTDLARAFNKLDNDNVSVWRKIEDFGGAIASIFGVPLKNLMKDLRALWQVIKSFIE